MLATRRPTTRLHRTRAVAAFVAVAALTGCSQVQDLAEEAQTQVGEVADTLEFCVSAVRLADAVRDQDVEAAVSAGEVLVDKAPDEIRPDAELVLAAAREAQAGDPGQLGSENVQDAAERLRQFTVDTCNPAFNDG